MRLDNKLSNIIFTLTFVWLQHLIERARSLAGTLISHVEMNNRTFNRDICHQYDMIVRKITSHSETTSDLVAQRDYVERLECEDLLDLRVRRHAQSSVLYTA